MAFDLARVSKGEGITIRHQKATSSFCRELLFDPQYKFGYRTVKAGKNLSQQMGFVTRFLNGASQEIKVKLNESRRLKFYQVKQRKENSIENSAQKNLKEDSKFNELKHFYKAKREKKNTQRTLFPRILSQISSCKLHKNLQHFIFSIPFFLVSFV